jgi:hypothetical protein
VKITVKITVHSTATSYSRASDRFCGGIYSLQTSGWTAKPNKQATKTDRRQAGRSARHMFVLGHMHQLFLHPEDEGSIFLRSVGKSIALQGFTSHKRVVLRTVFPSATVSL